MLYGKSNHVSMTIILMWEIDSWPASHVKGVLWSTLKHVKDEISPNNNIGWVESNFRNPTVKVWANLDYPLKRSNYAKCCMSPSLDGTLPEYVMPQENTSPLTLYIDFQILDFSWIPIIRLIKFNHKCMLNHLSPNIPRYKMEGRYTLRQVQFCEVCVHFH